MNIAQIISLLAAAVTAGTAIFYAALGEIVTEKSGILNLGVEGMMLAGAVAGFPGGQKQHQVGDLFDRAVALERQAGKQCFARLFRSAG